MKKIILAVLVLISMDAAAQGLRLHANANYVFDDKVDSYYSTDAYFNGKLKGGLQWGAALEYMLRPEYGLELSYYRQDSKANLNTFLYPVQKHDFDVSVNYVLLSGARYVHKPGSKAEAYGGVGLGVAFLDAKDPAIPSNSNSSTAFAWQVRGGVIIWASEKIGLKLQAQLQSAVQSVGGGVYFGTGGAGAGVSTYSSILQFGLGGGLVFNFNKSEPTPATQPLQPVNQ
jgi:hypothetical protein